MVDEFASTIGGISSLVAQSYSFQLQTLETKNKQALSSVVGDTEEANEKRIELESQYQKLIEKLKAVANLKPITIIAESKCDVFDAVSWLHHYHTIALDVDIRKKMKFYKST